MGISEVVVLRQSSMQVGDSLSDKVNDIEDAFFPGPYGQPLFIGFTEMDRHMEVEAEKVGMAHGYRYFGSPSDGGFAVRVLSGCVIRRVGYVKTLDTNVGMKTGNYGEKGIFFVTVQTRLGNIITDHITHWLTQYHLDSTPGAESRRERRFTQQTLDMIDQVQLHGVGRRISFWQGDTNIDEALETSYDKDALEYRFEQAGLLSVYDELREYPTTHGKSRTIDVIGSYNSDKRVSAEEVHVAGPRKSDHRKVDAKFLVSL